jgi:hypothetical protein
VGNKNAPEEDLRGTGLKNVQLKYKKNLRYVVPLVIGK